MRSRFDEQLTQLHNSLIEMGALVERAITKATEAFVSRNALVAQSILEGDSAINDKEREIESLCLKLILNQQPVARDLRQISTALKMITDMERIGDQAADISELCLILAAQAEIKKPKHIPQMAEATVTMVTRSIDAFVHGDIALAQSVIDYDDVVDALYVTVKEELIMLIHSDVEKGEQAVDLLQIAKYYERIGDHAVNIAEWVIFSITGKHNTIPH